MTYTKPKWWQYLPWHVMVFGVGMLLALVGLIVFAVNLANAGGQVNLTWDQASDCSIVTGWEVLVAPITTANPNPQPTAATIGVSIANTGTPPCGLAMTKTATVTAGVGPTRFWLRAVDGGSVKSKESNAVDASLPLGKPSGLTVVPQ